MYTNEHEPIECIQERAGRAPGFWSFSVSCVFIRGLIFFVFLSVTLWSAADTPATLPKTPEGAFEVYEWVIFIADPSQPQLNTNASTLFDSTLPDFVGGRRNPAPPEDEAVPTPLGVIRFSGSSGSDKVLPGYQIPA